MSRMTYTDWQTYALFRELGGKAKAEAFRHRKNAQHRERGTGNWPLQEDWVLINGWRAEDSFLQKRFFPWHFTDEEWEQYVDAEWIHIPYSAYDCTGRPFTQWMERYRVPGGTWVYRRIGLDV